MNPTIAAKADTAQLCISDAAGELEMHGELGSSMSTLLEYPGAADHRKNNNTNYADFKVECMTLQTFMAQRSIDIADVGLIKMDTEGACGGGGVGRGSAATALSPCVPHSPNPLYSPPLIPHPPCRRRGEHPAPAQAVDRGAQAQHPAVAGEEWRRARGVGGVWRFKAVAQQVMRRNVG